MLHRKFRGLWLLAALLVFTTTAFGESVEILRVVAGRCEGDIRLDGLLDEPAWREAGRIDDLTQQEPRPGEPTPFQTELRVLVDGENLYFGVVCHDPDPGAIAVHTMQRDGNLYGDQTLAIVLDTFGDRRRGYYFQINAAGARLDGLIAGPEDVSNDWDGIWDARTRRTEDGWTAELRIPAQTLRFTPGAESWGFNVQRRIARERMTLRWVGAMLDAQFLDFSRTGRLEGVADLRQARGLSISPFGLLHRDADLTADESSLSVDGGLDVLYNLTSELAAVLTINSDFAETEVDTRQVNLTRFPLFFPEKRAFFVEGSNLFSFGSGLGSDFIPFFSRRIGLYSGRQVPLEAGFKVLGRAGRLSIAALDAMMGESESTERTNLFAGRATGDLGERLTLGGIFTRGDPDGVHDNRLFGGDAVWRSSSFRGNKNLSLSLWGVGSGGEAESGCRSGWGLKFDYPNDLLDLFLTYKEFGDGLDPALGFLPRPGTRWFQGGGAFQPRPEGGFFDWVRQFYFECYASYVEGLDGRPQSWRIFTAPFNAQAESGEHIEANVSPQFERLEEAFEISEGVVIPAGDYRFTRYRVEAQSARHRAWRVGSTLWFGDFYTGTLSQWESFVTYTTPRGHLQIQIQSESDFGELPEGDFTQQLWQLKLSFAFTPDLIVSSYSQYDSESGNLGSNTRLRWTVHPGNDLFVVWNHGWEEPAGDDGGGLRPSSDQIVLKLRWTFRS